MIAIYSGTSAPRVYEPEPAREQTRQFRSPVFDQALDEYAVRFRLAIKYELRSKVAQDRLALIDAVDAFASTRDILNAFDAENRVKLGLEAL